MSAGSSRDLDVKIIRKLASNNVTGGHKKQIDTVASSWGFASHNEGKVRKRLEALAKDPDAPVEKYGGRDVVRLTSMEGAKEFIKEHGGELPWGLRE
jgi:hypothetical protein